MRALCASTSATHASGGELAAIYERAGFLTVQVSAETGEGLDRLRELISERHLPLQATPALENPAF